MLADIIHQKADIVNEYEKLFAEGNYFACAMIIQKTNQAKVLKQLLYCDNARMRVNLIEELPSDYCLIEGLRMSLYILNSFSDIQIHISIDNVI